jgi:tetratricopeptide (TPR) repeat protein
MAEPTDNKTQPEGGGPQGVRWSQVWQMPVLIVGLLLFGVGIYLALPSKPEGELKPDPAIDQLLDGLEEALAAEKLEEATEAVEGKLKLAMAGGSEDQWVRYEMYRGDLDYLQYREEKTMVQQEVAGATKGKEGAEAKKHDQGHEEAGGEGEAKPEAEGEAEGGQSHGGGEEGEEGAPVEKDPFGHLRMALKHYERVEELGEKLDPHHLQRLGEVMVGLHRYSEALDVLDRIEMEQSGLRHPVTRTIIEERMKQRAERESIEALLSRFEEEVAYEPRERDRREQAVWSIGVRADMQVAAGEPSRAVDFLQRSLVKLMDEGGDEDLSALQVLLAGAYEKLGEYEESQRWYKQAQQNLSTTDELNPVIWMGLGRTEMAKTGDERLALEAFSVAEEVYPKAATHLDALISRADCEARIGLHPEAIMHFGHALKQTLLDRSMEGERVEHLHEVIQKQYQVNLAREDYELALGYLELLQKLYEPDLPDALLLDVATAHERIGDQGLLRIAGGETGDEQGSEGGGDDEGAVDAVFQEAAKHLEKAAGYYLEHAHKIAAADDELSATSMWNAARCYDRARMWDRAIGVYTDYVKTRQGDPRQVQAIRLLGLAYLSTRQNQMAIQMFTQLLDGFPRSPEAYASLVPLAESYEAIGDHESSERTLLQVLTNHPVITPDSLQYQLALISLGKMHLKQGNYEPAIERLTEAVDRYGETSQGLGLRYRLADAYRLSIGRIDDDLKEPMPLPAMTALKQERVGRLGKAQELFDAVVKGLEAREESRRTVLERLFLRNAYFYRADCVYDLGRYEQAIDLYELAARRWADHPASLMALVQIVNSYCELGRVQEAKIANDRARWQLKRIPDEAFKDATLPMTRKHWEEWLRWGSELDLFTARANAEKEAPAAPSAGRAGH